MSKKNVIAITAYNKPELLFIYLEQLFKGGMCFMENHKVRIYTEIGYDKDTDEVVRIYSQMYPKVDMHIVVRPKHPTCPLVGFHNILTSYLLAAQETTDYVIIGEEDMLPTQDILCLAHDIYWKFLAPYERIFCFCHKLRRDAERKGDPNVLMGDYHCTSPFVISKRAIEKYMRPYLTMNGYFENPVQFNVHHFADTRWHPAEHTHHDGAIERIMWKNKLFALKPDQTRSMHVGLTGIFSGGQAPQGTLPEKIAEYRDLIKDVKKLRARSSCPDQMVVTDPEGPHRTDLVLDLDRTSKGNDWLFDPNNEFKAYIKSHENL